MGPGFQVVTDRDVTNQSGLVDGMSLIGNKAQRILQGAEYQLAQKQAIGPSHFDEKYAVCGPTCAVAPQEALLQVLWFEREVELPGRFDVVEPAYRH